MAENWLLIVAILGVAAVIIFGAANILTAAGRISPTIVQIQEETNTRCDLCLSQFQSEGVSCNHLSSGKVCVALSNYYCAMNCSVQIK